MENLIRTTFYKYGFNLSDQQITQFKNFYEFLVQENEKYNLTAITEKEEVVVKHFIDSVLPEKEIAFNSFVIDVGSGAGFPGIPLKIVRPDLKIVLIDSLQKRVNFLNQTIALLGLDNIQAFHTRAEDFAIKNREKFDVALSRAVASIPSLSEYLIPFVKIGGKVLMYKGERLNEELSIGQNAIKTLGCQVENTLKFDLKEVDSKRFVLILKKIHATNQKYPRGKNLPKTKPIM